MVGTRSASSTYRQVGSRWHQEQIPQERSTMNITISKNDGTRINLGNLQPQDVSIEDIAHSLSQQCRFNGRTKFFYSVAQHCLMVSWMLKDAGHSPRMQLLGLLHDATEAYTGDIIKPLKEVLLVATPFGSLFANEERRLMARLLMGLGIIYFSEDEEEIIHGFDESAYRVEMRDLMGDPAWARTGPVPVYRATPRVIENVREEFIQSYYDLKDQGAFQA